MSYIGDAGTARMKQRAKNNLSDEERKNEFVGVQAASCCCCPGCPGCH